jgi:sulfide:quinone oxidoreductase
MSSTTPPNQTLDVLIAGGGVAALEGMLALRELAGDRVNITLLAPEQEFVYRPMSVLEPFARGAAERFELELIARDAGAEFIEDAVGALDASQSVVSTRLGAQLHYDALLLAPGALMRQAFDHVVAIDDRHLDDRLHGVIQDVEDGYVRSIAFIVPTPPAWPLPVYELALMTARRGYDMNQETTVTVVTCEEAPLALFGDAVSRRVAQVLEQDGVTVITSAHAAVPERGHVTIHPGGRTLVADRVLALPLLFGPALPGVPETGPDGFIPVDPHGKVPGLQRVWAAGDAASFPVKHGGLAALEADAAAESIAAFAGVAIDPKPFDPEIHAIFLGGDKPLYLSAHLAGGHGSTSTVSEEPTPALSTGKISAKYLGAYLEGSRRSAAP